MSSDLGFRILQVSRLIRRCSDRLPAKARLERMTGTHGWILGYLYDHRDADTYQRDLENYFELRRSTVSGILKLMEQNGLIIKYEVPGDKRLKRIVLTRDAVEMHEAFSCEMAGLEKAMLRDLSEKDLDKLQAMLATVTDNLDRFEKQLTEAKEKP